jgi:hypothetical protein
MKLFQHFEDAAKFHRACANSKSACAESYNKLARGAEGRADFATAKAYRAIADEHGKIAAAHSAHAEQLSTMANGGPDVWGLAVETVNADGAPSNQKVADSFFSKFFYGEPGERPGNRATDPVPALSTPQSMFE